MEKRLDGNYTRMLRAILNKSWRQHPTKLQLYGHLPPIIWTVQNKRNRHAGHWWRSKYELKSDVLLWTTSSGRSEVGIPATIYIYYSFVLMQDVPRKTYRERWPIETGGERRSRRSTLAAWHDNDVY